MTFAFTQEKSLILSPEVKGKERKMNILYFLLRYLLCNKNIVN